MPVQGSPPWAVSTLALIVGLQMDREDCGRLYHFTGQMTAPDGSEMESRMDGDEIAIAAVALPDMSVMREKYTDDSPWLLLGAVT